MTEVATYAPYETPEEMAAYADRLHEVLFENFLKEIKEFDEESKSGIRTIKEGDGVFMRDIRIAFEFIRAAMYRSLKVDHVLHELMDSHHFFFYSVLGVDMGGRDLSTDMNDTELHGFTMEHLEGIAAYAAWILSEDLKLSEELNGIPIYERGEHFYDDMYKSFEFVLAAFFRTQNLKHMCHKDIVEHQLEKYIPKEYKFD